MEIGFGDLAERPAARFVPSAGSGFPVEALLRRYEAVAGREYVGTFNAEHWYRVHVEEPGRAPVPLRQHVCHSPGGYAWGYSGSGPSDLALSLLADATDDGHLAWLLHHAFRDAVVATWPGWDGAIEVGPPAERWRYPATEALDWVLKVFRFGSPDGRMPAELVDEYAELRPLTPKALGILEIRPPRGHE